MRGARQDLSTGGHLGGNGNWAGHSNVSNHMPVHAGAPPDACMSLYRVVPGPKLATGEEGGLFLLLLPVWLASLKKTCWLDKPLTRASS